MGVAFYNISPQEMMTGLFPHILMKNVKVKINFRRQDKWFDPPRSQVRFFEEALGEHAILNPIDHPQSLTDAEFILLCGLPGCGKTCWAQQHMEANPKKNYLLLSINAVNDQLTLG